MSGLITRTEEYIGEEELQYGVNSFKYVRWNKLKSLFTFFTQLINPKTLYFNFKYLPFQQAVKLPFYVSYGTRLIKTKGQVMVDGPIRPGMIRIGFGHVGIFDKKRLRALIEIDGTIHFGGSALIKFGSKISVGEGAQLYIGKDFRISPNSKIVCFHKIRIGNNVRVSWETIMMDTDFHKILDLDGTQLNEPKEIVIGNNVWIGMGASIMKGSNIQDNNIIGANTYLNKSITESNCIIGGSPAKILKREVTWVP